MKGLADKSNVRPDLQIFFPGRMLLTDIVVSHPITTSRVQRQISSTTRAQYGKQTKYSVERSVLAGRKGRSDESELQRLTPRQGEELHVRVKQYENVYSVAVSHLCVVTFSLLLSALLL